MSSSQKHQPQEVCIPVVGIVGGVGAGKSTVVRNVVGARLFVIDADRIGHELLLTEEIRNQLRHVFGERILNESGQIDRKLLADKVFGVSDDKTENRRRLNDIMHPAIRSAILNSINRAPQDVDAIILDAAVLLEANWADQCDFVIFVDTPIEMRRKRVAVNRGWTPEELQRREESQWSVDQKRQASQFIVDNSGAPESAAEQLRQIIQSLRRTNMKP